MDLYSNFINFIYRQAFDIDNIDFYFVEDCLDVITIEFCNI